MSTAAPTTDLPTDLDGLVALAQREHRAGRLAEAAAAYRKLVALRPGYAEALNNLGKVLEQQGQLDEAVTQYQRAVALKPELFQPHYSLGNVLRRQGNHARAAAHYERAVSLRTDFAHGHNSLGNALRKLGKLDRAVASFRRALAINPRYADAHNDLGNVLVDQHKFAEAATEYQQAAALNPGLFHAHNNLGNVLREQGKFEEAVARYRQALALRPDYAEAYNNLGNVLKDLGQLDQAVAQYERALALKPELFQAHNNLGNILKELGRLEQALAKFQQAVTVRPDFAEAHHNLGNLLREQGKFDEALPHLEQAIALDPTFAEAYFNLGNVLKEQRKLDEAVANFERAIALKPKHAPAHNNLGTVLRRLGRGDDALARFQRALALKPDYAEAHNNLGNLRREQGKLDEAARHYQQALAFKPDIAEAHYNRSDLKTFRPEDAELAALEALAAEKRLSPGKMTHVHFALGKALEDTGDYGRAFEHWLKGNALRRREVNYQEAGHLESYRRVADLFNAPLMERLRGAGDPSSVPIFVLGMPRSGSTLVEQILASHPQVYGAGELKNLDRVVREASDSDGLPVPIPRCIVTPDAEGIRRLGQAYLESLPKPGKGEIRITDKMPKNFLHAGLIHLMLPGARIIHTMRDPVDTCISCFSRCFTRGQPFSYDLAELGRYYRGYYQLMEHWRSVLPAGIMLDVVYEEVVDNLEQQARRLIEYCGLPWDDRCLKFHETERPVATASNVQVRRPLYTSSVARWRRYEPYLQPLLAELECCRRAK